MNKKYITWKEVEEMVERLAIQILDVNSIREEHRQIKSIYGVSRGGLIPAVLLSHKTGLPIVTRAGVSRSTIVVDDISDKGITLKKEVGQFHIPLETATLHMRFSTEYLPTIYASRIMNNDWIVYPWEKDDSKTEKDN